MLLENYINIVKINNKMRKSIESGKFKRLQRHAEHNDVQ